MTFELAPVHGLTEDELKEMANRFAEKCQKAAQQTVKDAIAAGNALNEVQSRMVHGKWRQWLAQNFDYSTRTALTYQTLAANVKRFTFEPTSIRKAMEIIAREEELEAEQSMDEKPITPRAERVTGRVAVAKPDHSADTSKKVEDNAVPAEPKTNTLHKPATAKAKESDRPTPAVVTPEIVEEPDVLTISPSDVSAIIDACLTYVPFEKLREKILPSHWALLLIQVLECVPVGDKKAAKVIRQAADRVDPPAIGAPSIEAVEAWAAENRLPDFDANKFFNHYELAGWKYGKAKTPIKDWKRAAANAYAGGKGWAVDGANRLPF